MAAGPTTTLSGPDGQLLRLTPVASWSEAALDPSAFDPRAKSQTAQPSDSAPASPASQGPQCLTPQGQLESDQEALVELVKQSDRLSPSRRLLFTLLPAPGRSFTCLLVSTTSADLLQDTPAVRLFWQQLSRSVRWPPPPGH